MSRKKSINPKIADNTVDNAREATAFEVGVWTTPDGQLSAALPHASAMSMPAKSVSRVDVSPYDIEIAKHASWGGNDLLPQRIQSRLSKVPMASRAVFDMASLMVGKDVFYVADSDLANGESTAKRGSNPEIELFKRRNRLHHQFLFGLANDISHVYNGFVEFITDPFGDKIVQVRRLPAAWCRISRIDERSLRSEWLYYSAAFQSGYMPTDYNDAQYVAKIPLYDPFDFAFLEKIRVKKVRRFAMHIKPPSPQEGYYAVAPWNGLYLDNGWVDVAAAVPRVVKAMQDNQIALKYIIYISEQYMISRFPQIGKQRGWAAMDDAQKSAAQKKVTKEIESKLVGVDNVFSSLTMIAKEGPDGKMYGKITIEAVDDKSKSGTWIPDTIAANREILYAHMLNPTIVGVQAQGGSEAGSGSDKRESRNDAVSQIAVLQAHVFDPLNCIVKDYNDWAFTFMPDNIIHTTTNKEENGIKTSDKRTQIIN